jgi:hypothetical protein
MNIRRTILWLVPGAVPMHAGKPNGSVIWEELDQAYEIHEKEKYR